MTFKISSSVTHEDHENETKSFGTSHLITSCVQRTKLFKKHFDIICFTNVNILN